MKEQTTTRIRPELMEQLKRENEDVATLTHEQSLEIWAYLNLIKHTIGKLMQIIIPDTKSLFSRQPTRVLSLKVAYPLI